MVDPARPAPAEILVVVPTYNEAATISEVARRLFSETGERADLLVVDDSSADGTVQAVRALGSPRVHVIERPSRMGLGSAYIEGFRWALARHYNAIVEMDGDLSHDPAVVLQLVDELQYADLAIGSRYVEGGDVVNWAPFRRYLSRAGNLYARVVLGGPINDWTSGYRAYRRAWLASIDLNGVFSEGYAFQIEMTRRVLRAGGAIIEIPIVFTERAQGASKMTAGIVAEAFLSVAAWGAKDLLARGRRAGTHQGIS